eukprot:scaffold85_cov358-Pavlova_lutheri.AAC.13
MGHTQGNTWRLQFVSSDGVPGPKGWIQDGTYLLLQRNLVPFREPGLLRLGSLERPPRKGVTASESHGEREGRPLLRGASGSHLGWGGGTHRIGWGCDWSRLGCERPTSSMARVGSLRAHTCTTRTFGTGRRTPRARKAVAKATSVEKTPGRVTARDVARIWWTNIEQTYGEKPSVDGAPVAEGKVEDLVQGALFLALYDYFQQSGSVYKLMFGPKAFMIVSDPVIAKYILRENSFAYDKGVLAEILEPIMGKGLIPADYETWKTRRRAIVPGLHQAWLNRMVQLFNDCSRVLVNKLEGVADQPGKTLDMESEFCSLGLDIIGLAVFNYDFGSVTKESPVIKAVYNTLREAEHRSTFYFPYWHIPGAKWVVPRQRRFQADLKLINDCLDELIRYAQETRKEEELEDLEKKDYTNITDPSLLRFLVDMRGEQVTNKQLRDDLMTMLVAGHETTAAVLTWALFCLMTHPEAMAKAQAEVDAVLGSDDPTYEKIHELKFVRLVLAEALRLYPEPPILIRRALEDDVLPEGGCGKRIRLLKGTDVFISIWNLHRSPDLWQNPEKFYPERFLEPHSNPGVKGWEGFRPELNGQLYPNEVSSDFAFLPFGGGSRKCIGDQFAMLEATVALSMLLRDFSLTLACEPEDVGVQTGATIHTANGMPVSVARRVVNPSSDKLNAATAA